jgi:hypothetical protein
MCKVLSLSTKPEAPCCKTGYFRLSPTALLPNTSRHILYHVHYIMCMWSQASCPRQQGVSCILHPAAGTVLLLKQGLSNRRHALRIVGAQLKLSDFPETSALLPSMQQAISLRVWSTVQACLILLHGLALAHTLTPHQRSGVKNTDGGGCTCPPTLPHNAAGPSSTSLNRLAHAIMTCLTRQHGM